jgi:O-antigen ligase
MFLALCLPFVVHSWRTAPRGLAKGVASLGLAGGVAGLLATFSRGSWFAVLAAPGVLFLAGGGKFVWRFWGAALLGAVAFDVLSGGLLSTRLEAAVTDLSGLQRLALMSAGLAMFFSSPLVGIGPGGYQEALNRSGFVVPGSSDSYETAHNAYIHAAAESGALGFVGLVLFLGVSAVVVLRAARAAARSPGMAPVEADLRRTLLWAFAIACILGLFEWTLLHGVGQLIMLIVAMAAAAPDLRGARA